MNVDTDSTERNDMPNIDFTGLCTTLKAFAHLSERITEVAKSISEVMTNFGQMLSEIVPTDYFQGFISTLQDIYKNPDSLLNYLGYEKDLNSFHWAWPFGFDSAIVKNLVESVQDEKTFDNYMVHYFAAGRDVELMCAVAQLLPSNQKILFGQVCNAYNNKDYAIANNAIMSIIDNLLSKYVVNKGITVRYGIFKPIEKILYGDNVIFDIACTIRIVLLSHNIDFIFENYSFKEKISIKTNKKVRRL